MGVGKLTCHSTTYSTSNGNLSSLAIILPLPLIIALLTSQPRPIKALQSSSQEQKVEVLYQQSCWLPAQLCPKCHRGYTICVARMPDHRLQSIPYAKGSYRTFVSTARSVYS